jgi:hypothetical protein
MMVAHKSKARRQEQKMLDALDELGIAKELVVDLFQSLPKTKQKKIRARVEAVAGDMLEEDD